jgi:hypothetical protein
MKISRKFKIIILLSLISIFAFSFKVTEGRVFDLRTNKIFNVAVSPVQVDNLPHLYCCSWAAYAYSGIFVGQTVRVSGNLQGEKSLKIVFPSGKTETLDMKNGFFEKEITFDEEGTYLIGSDSFDVVYKAIPISPTPVYRDVFGIKPELDGYSGAFVDWNDAILVEIGKSVDAYFLVVGTQGNPISDLNTQAFTTDPGGIAKISIDFKASYNVYGPVKKLNFVKIIFDKNGNLTYTSQNKKLKSILNNGDIFVSMEDFVNFSMSEFEADIFKRSLEFGEGFVYIKDRNTAFPVESYKVNGDTFIDLKSFMKVIESFTYGTIIKYFPDRTEFYVAIEPDIP